MKTRTMTIKHSRNNWITLIAAFVAIIIVTIYKDLALTGNQPNLLFYITVPLVSMLGSAAAGYAALKIWRKPITFSETLFMVVLSDFLGQVYENLSKLVYYRLWAYPGWLFFIGFLPVAFLIPGYLLKRWHKLHWLLALFIALVFFIGGMTASLAFTAVTGIETPGS
jgi:hypothetical protein